MYRILLIFTLRRATLTLMFITLIIYVHSSVLSASDLVLRKVTVSQADLGLRDALFQRDLKKFERYLDAGGDPTVWFENSPYGWVYCAATEHGLEAYLERIVDKGFDVNYRQKNIHNSSKLPLTCAVQFDNVRAVEILIAAGADPADKICSDCDRRYPMSVLAEAVLVSKYHLAVFLLDKGQYSDRQIESVISLIDRLPVDESNPRNILRLQLAERIRELGFEVNPWTE